MRWLVLVCASSVCASAMGGGELDSLLDKTERLEQRSIKGFVYKQQPQVQLTAPEELFSDKTEAQPEGLGGAWAGSSAGGSGSSAGGSSAVVAPRRSPGGSQYVTYREFATEMRAIDRKLIEIETNQNKVTTILSNMHGSNERVIDGVNLTMKLVEVVGAIVAAVIGVASAMVAYARVKRARS